MIVWMPLKSCDRTAAKSKPFPLLWPVLFLIIILQHFEHWLSLLCLHKEGWIWEARLGCPNSIVARGFAARAEATIAAPSNPVSWFSPGSCSSPTPVHSSTSLGQGGSTFYRNLTFPRATATARGFCSWALGLWQNLCAALWELKGKISSSEAHQHIKELLVHTFNLSTNVEKED